MSTLDNADQVLVLIASGGAPDREAYLQEAIDSLYDQFYWNWHAIIASPRKPAVELGPKVSWILGGSTAAKNRNILLDKWQASSEFKYACWLDDDDFFVPSKIQQQVVFLNEHPEIDIVYTNIQTIGDQMLVRYVSPDKYTNNLDTWYDNINHASVMMRRSVLEAPRYCEQLTTYEGDDLWLYGLWAYGLNFDVIKKSLYFYRLHSTNNSTPSRLESKPGYLEDKALLQQLFKQYQDTAKNNRKDI